MRQFSSDPPQPSKESAKKEEKPKVQPQPVEKPKIKEEVKQKENQAEKPEPKVTAAEKPVKPEAAPKPAEVPKPAKPQEDRKPEAKVTEPPEPAASEPKPNTRPAEEPKPTAKPKEEPKPAPKQKEEPKPTPKPTPKPKDEPKPAVAKPKEEPKPAAKPKEEPKPAPKAAKKPVAVVDVKVGGKYVVAVGEGGCRGKNWRSAPWPIDAGVKSLAACAQACLEQSCTAFHQLHEVEDSGQAECFLFGNAEVLAVRGLGGVCYRLSDKPGSKLGPAHVVEDDDETELELKGPVYMAPLGRGRCRGPGWTFKRWPVLKGVLSPQACAEACARRRGCTAFDLSAGGEGGALDCALYGHAKVVPASGVPGSCFVLSDSPGKVPASFGVSVAVEEEEEEEEAELEVKGDVDFHQLGRGRCRGPGWMAKRWPVVKGRLTAKECALACAKKRGCSGFDIGAMGEGLEECALYGHKERVNFSQVSVSYSNSRTKILSPTDYFPKGTVS